MNLAVVACLGACATDDGPREVVVIDPWGSGTAGAGVSTRTSGFGTEREVEPEPAEPFQLEFPALITQSARWASVDVRITKVQQVRGEPGGSAEFPGFLDRNQIYVQLELAIANKNVEEVSYYDRDTWDLKLANGTRLTSVNPLGVSVLPGDETTAAVYYDVDEVVDLAGAALLLEGAERGVLEPEVLPLDVASAHQFPRRIATLVGKDASFLASSATGQVHVDEAAYDVNCGRVLRAARNKRCVWLKLAYTEIDDNGGYVSLGDLRIVVDGRASAPFEYEHGSVAGHATRVFFAAFEIDKNAERVDIVFPNGSQPGNRLSVDLAIEALLATDIP